MFIIKMSWEKRKMCVDVPLLTRHCRREDVTIIVAAELMLKHTGRKSTS